jgi:hypothetical protein
LRKAALLGLAALVYALAAWAAAPGFFDGITPPEPYRWVSPPPNLRSGNKPPLPGHASFKVGSDGVVDPGSAFTGDGQASLSFIPGAFSAPADASPVTVDITPVSSFPAPNGITFTTNVYLIKASRPLVKEALVTLRYSDQTPAPADVYLAQPGGGWKKLGSTGSAAPFTIAVRTGTLGYFAGGYPSNAGQSARGPRVGGGQALPILTAAAILVVLLAGIPLAVLRRRGASEPEADEGDEEGEDREDRERGGD